MRSQDRVVWLHNGCGNLGSWVHRKLELALLAVVNRKALHKKSTEAGSCTTPEGVEDKETLESRAIVYIKQGSEVFLKYSTCGTTYQRHDGSCPIPDRSTPFQQCNDLEHLDDMKLGYNRPRIKVYNRRTIVRSILLASNHLFWVE